MSSPLSPPESGAAQPDWQDIEDLLDQVALASKSPAPPEEFYRFLLDNLVPALVATGGAVWSSSSNDRLHLESQRNLGSLTPQAGNESDAHAAWVAVAMREQNPAIAAPGQPPLGNLGSPPRTLVLQPFRIDPRTRGAIELVVTRDLSAAAGRSYLRVLAAISELVEDFHRQRELLQLRGQGQSWLDQEQFLLAIHQSLDVERTAYALANESRRLLNCDRTSVLVIRRGHLQAVAISGVERLDRRSDQVQALEALADRVVQARETLWYHDGAGELPTQVEAPLHAYLDKSGLRSIVVVPLFAPSPDKSRPPRVTGALVADRFSPSGANDHWRERVEAAAMHGSLALSNAIAHERLPLASLGRQLQKLGVLTTPRQWPLALWVLGALALVGAMLTLIPANFQIEAPAELQPVRRRDVFASDTGVVSRLLVDHAQTVHAGEPLVALSKPSLDLELRRVSGEIETAAKRLSAIQAERLDNPRQPPNERKSLHELTADEEEIKEQLRGLRDQRAILEEQRKALVITSPIDGQVLTWNVEPQLASRPVERGQVLLTVGDLAGPWELDVHLPERRVGHVLGAQKEIKPELDVEFAMTSSPAERYQGQVAKVALFAEPDETHGSHVLVRVDFDETQISRPRPGATATARIDCGTRSLAYVWFHDLLEFVQTHGWWW